jgi:hypothetical protein
MVESTKYFKAIDFMFRILLFLILFFPAYGMDTATVVASLGGMGFIPQQQDELRDVVEAIRVENPYITTEDFNLVVHQVNQGADFDGMLFLLDEFRTKDPCVLVGKLYTNTIKMDALKQATVRDHITALKNKYVHKAGYSPDDWIEIVDTASLLIAPSMTEKHVTRIIDALEAINVSPVDLGEVIQLNSQHDILFVNERLDLF